MGGCTQIKRGMLVRSTFVIGTRTCCTGHPSAASGQLRYPGEREIEIVCAGANVDAIDVVEWLVEHPELDRVHLCCCHRSDRVSLL